MHLFLALFATLLTILPISAEKITLHRSPVDTTTDTITLHVTLDPEQAIREDSINFTINHPDFVIQSWESDKAPISFFDKKLKETKMGYADSVQFTLVVQHPEAVPATQPADLFMHYMTNTSKHPQEKRFALHDVARENEEDTEEVDNPLEESSVRAVPAHGSENTGLIAYLQKLWLTISNFFAKLKEHTMTLVTTTESRFTQFLFALILGIFMSLTPCIYPMIPITVGVLGTSTHNKLLHNFLLAFSYSCGLAFTFAVLGLLAALFGAQSGQILSNPWFVAVLVIVLGYLGFSSIGFYEMWIPSFMKPNSKNIKRGSFLSAFLFGMASGTIASPCMSPGLALVLTIVAGMGNMFLGFLLLFVFGIGASAPLLIIGTFSASLHFLPKAGMWMVEFKKVFGFMLLGMCFFYLKNVVPTTFSYALPALFFVWVGGYYLSRIAHYRSSAGKVTAFVLGVALLTTAGYLGYKAYAAYHGFEVVDHHGWRSDFEQAQQDARYENKRMLLDFGASWCSACNQLEKKMLHKPELTRMFDQVVAVRVDGSKQGAEPYNTLIQKYSLRGIPAVLLTDADGNLIKQWGGELADRTAADFAEELEAYLK